MILNALAEKLKRRAKADFKGRHYEATLILQAVSWYLRYRLSYRDIEELFRERGLEVDHSTLNRWVLAYAPLIERRLRAFRICLVRSGPTATTWDWTRATGTALAGVKVALVAAHDHAAVMGRSALLVQV